MRVWLWDYAGAKQPKAASEATTAPERRTESGAKSRQPKHSSIETAARALPGIHRIDRNLIQSSWLESAYRISMGDYLAGAVRLRLSAVVFGSLIGSRAIRTVPRESGLKTEVCESVVESLRSGSLSASKDVTVA